MDGDPDHIPAAAATALPVYQLNIRKLTPYHSDFMTRSLLRSLPRVCVLAVGGTVVLLAGCRAAAIAYGPDAVSARANADGLASAIEQRFTRVVRHPKFSNARMRMGRYALAPSKLVGDTALWTGSRAVRGVTERSLEVSGSLVGGQYTFAPRAPSSTPARTGDSRHVLHLTHIDKGGDWQWSTLVENAVGPVAPEQMADVMRALFASAERSAPAIRSDYRSAFPRTAVAFGRMVQVDSISTVAQSDGSTSVMLRLAVSDAGLRSGFPELAKYVRKYYAPARYRFRVRDAGGAEWFDIEAAKSVIVLRFRSRRGELQPLIGSQRSMPDTLALHIEGSAKIGMFTVGASKLIGEFVHVHTPTQRAWAMRFTKEPEWDLPFLAEQLLHTPLKHPFDGPGVQFSLGFVRAGSGQTVLTRTTTLAVRESAIMRFLGNLGFTAMSDYAGKVEEEENRFLAEGFAAMRADVASLAVWP